jgi:acetate kinase
MALGSVSQSLAPAHRTAARPPERTLLTLNGGSSSLKYALHSVVQGQLEPLLDGSMNISTPRDCLLHLRAEMQRRHLSPPALIAHRVVHGGPSLQQHCLIDDEVLAKIDAAAALAPLHNAAALDGMCAAADLFDRAVQFACFDTVFHVDMPEEARTLSVGVLPDCPDLRRYGFHGLSCESILHQLGSPPPRRLIVAHLGHGASLTAISAGRSIGNTMGLTPSGGLLMGTRSGDLDPGVLTYLMRERQCGPKQLDALVNHRSGLLGISGSSSDLRSLREAAPGDPRAGLAVRMFCRSVAYGIAGMIAMLDGVDMLVFTGGIGENDAATRADVCASLGWMGIRIDPNLPTKTPEGAVQAQDSRCEIRVLPSRENEQMARHALAVFNQLSPRRHETIGT